MFLILLSIIKNYLCVTRRLSAKDKQESKRYISSKNEALEQNVSCLKATLVYKLQMYVCNMYIPLAITIFWNLSEIRINPLRIPGTTAIY